jgi:HPt (histidine-containing phosphotransfer) domain-containing protein
VGMNDYIAKPVDERLLYTKIAGIVKKPAIKAYNTAGAIGDKRNKCINLDYLSRRTKSNPKLMVEMISLYLEQIPPLVTLMKESLENNDLPALQAAVHQIIPSFSIMGIAADFEDIAKNVQDLARSRERTDTLPGLILQLEQVCAQACMELEEERSAIKIPMYE